MNTIVIRKGVKVKVISIRTPTLIQGRLERTETKPNAF